MKQIMMWVLDAGKDFNDIVNSHFGIVMLLVYISGVLGAAIVYGMMFGLLFN